MTDSIKLKFAYYDVKTIRKGKEIKVVLTKERIDRDGEKISVRTLKLENFSRNPVMGWGHKLLWGEHNDLVGEWKDNQVEVDKDGIDMWTAIPRFANHQKAKEIEEMVNDGFLKTVSIGFRGGQYADDGVTLEGVEPFEASWVPVPSNVDSEVREKAYKLGEDVLDHAAKYLNIKPILKEYRRLFLSKELQELLGYTVEGKELKDIKNIYDLITKKALTTQNFPNPENPEEDDEQENPGVKAVINASEFKKLLS